MPDAVLLVNANRIRPPIAPIALDYLADSLNEGDVPFAVADLCLASNPDAALAEAATASDPRLVAISFRNTDDCYCATQHSFIPDLARLVSDIRDLTDARIVIGGAGFSVAPAGILRRTGADFGIIGDGERPLVALAHGGAEETIAGLVHRADGEIRENRPTWAPLQPEPLNRAYLDHERYFREGGQAGIETKRGCPAKCVYCADGHSKGGRVRTRPPAAVAEEMLSLASRGIDCFHTCDAEFNCDPLHAQDVCRALIARGASRKLSWYAYCSPTPFSPRLAEFMSRAGCVGINFGADNANAGMLRRLGRDHTADDIGAAIEACKANGIAVMLDLLLGSPGETPETVAESIDFLKQIGPTCVGIGLGVRIYANTAIAAELMPPGDRPGFRGQVEDNDDLAMPLFYLAPELGDDPVGLLKSCIAGDERFFFGWPDDTQADYNYDDNPELTQAVADGMRGAYWDILRKQRGL